MAHAAEGDLASELAELRVLPGKPVPKQRYMSRDFMSLEWLRLWRRSWLLAAHVGDLPGAGSIVRFDVGHESVLVVRKESGELAAFHNVCQHRGNRLCAAHLSRADRITCAYHRWTYALDGRLIGVPDSERFESLDASRHGLKPISCQEAAGFVFVNFDVQPQPLREFLKPVLAELELYDLGSWQLVNDSEMLVAGNWKLSSDVNNEGYHLASLHPSLLGVADDTASRFEAVGPHSRLTLPIGAPSQKLGRLDEPPEALSEMLREAGLDPAMFRQRVADARPALQRAIRSRAEHAGLDLSRLEDERLTDNFQIGLFPNVQLNLYASRLLLFRHRPHPTDPEQAWFDQQVYERLPLASARRPRPERKPAGRTQMGAMLEADLAALESVAQGMRSSGFEGLVLCDGEQPIRHLHEVLDRYLFDAAPG